MYVKAGNTHIVHNRTIEKVYDELIRLVMVCGKNVTDQRRNRVRELKHVWTEITTSDITYPSIGPTSKLFGDNFFNGLLNPDVGTFDYTYGERLNLNNNIEEAIYILKENPESRRVVLNIFSSADLGFAMVGNEVPCATQVYLNVENECLDMTLMMRSNDIISAWPSDVYGFRKLQEHIANELNREIGTFRHYTENAHIILNNDEQFVKNRMGLK